MQFLLQLRLQCLVPHSGSALPHAGSGRPLLIAAAARSFYNKPNGWCSTQPMTQTFKRFPASFQPITGINPLNPEIHPLSLKQDRRGVALCVRLPAPEPPCLLPVKLKPKPKPPPPPIVEPAGAPSLTTTPKTTSPRIGFVPSTPAPAPTSRRLSYRVRSDSLIWRALLQVPPLPCRA
jgi:hypothetical protein